MNFVHPLQSICIALYTSFCESYQEVEEEGNHSPQEVGGKGVGGQVVWGEVVDYQEGHFSAGWEGEEEAGHCHGD